MSQRTFFPIPIEHEEPYSDSKDLKLIGYTKDRIRYAIKRVQDGELLPISEWIGHRLCELCGISVPEYHIVACVDGQLAFGSRWEDAAEQIDGGTGPVRALELLASHAADISAIFAIDQFFPNPDRHAGNYLFVRRAETPMCLAMDFSRAGPSDEIPMGALPLDPVCSTLVVIERLIRDRLRKFDSTSFGRAKARLASIKPDEFYAILNDAPDEWFVVMTRDEFCRWWDNESSIRVDGIAP
jgi:hypothetical protein